jgi:hypothetical protein
VQERVQQEREETRTHASTQTQLKGWP